ncbi:hypothetical protein [Cohnella sp. GbtcB17]|uniref:hypothetical protein n=1 Tax=Cohnella sp. GbtcB17 TaxID=2824762 RepID=UPI001C30A312|nr:hypothetical protein [Cohnella sp. GbtcB17]
MTLNPEDREHHALFKEAVRQAVLRQEEAIADFMRCAALHLQISVNTRSNDRGENAPSDLHALSETLIASARIAEALASLQGTTRRGNWLIAWDLGRNIPPSENARVQMIRYEPSVIQARKRPRQSGWHLLIKTPLKLKLKKTSAPLDALFIAISRHVSIHAS